VNDKVNEEVIKAANAASSVTLSVTPIEAVSTK